MSSDYRVLVLAGLTIRPWGFWDFFGKVALDRNMAPRSVFLAEVFTSAVCAVVFLERVRRGVRRRMGPWTSLLLLRTRKFACVDPRPTNRDVSRSRRVSPAELCLPT